MIYFKKIRSNNILTHLFLLTEKLFCTNILIKEEIAMDTKGKIIGVAVILLIILAATAIARGFEAVFAIVTVLAIVYLFAEQEEVITLE